ncbi:MAG TPA: phosphatidate cytidylyltransferase [Chitinophagaceae bacterium]|nr:phosphatidate cytidylyltransferase [Chitinophagaceae bacterium]
MAFNLASFKTRTLTAAVFVVVMLAGLLLNQWSFFILFSIIHFGCWVEYQRLVSLIDKEYASISSFHKYGVMIAGWCIMLYFTNDHFTLFGIRLHALGWWAGLIFVFVLPLIELLFASNIRLKNIAHSAFGLLYISLPMGLYVNLSDAVDMTDKAWDRGLWQSYEWGIPAFVIACMWINDTMAYIVGSLIGKTPFSKISPKKTWEGTIGGIILCAAVAGYLAYSFIPYDYFSFELASWIILAGIAAIAGTAGDLLESKLKRLADVKDSGLIMPGHGGFLDRFDSLLVAAPFVWLTIELMKWWKYS